MHGAETRTSDSVVKCPQNHQIICSVEIISSRSLMGLYLALHGLGLRQNTSITFYIILYVIQSDFPSLVYLKRAHVLHRLAGDWQGILIRSICLFMRCRIIHSESQVLDFSQRFERSDTESRIDKERHHKHVFASGEKSIP